MNPANVQKWGKESTHHGKCWLFFFDIMACLNIWSSFISGPVEKCGITEFIAGSITISSIVPETVEHPQTTFPPLCFTAGMKRLLSAFAWDKNICCYCSQKPLSLIHLSRVHVSKQPDLWLYVHCQTLVSLSCSLRFFLACLPCQSNVSLSDTWSLTPTDAALPAWWWSCISFYIAKGLLLCFGGHASHGQIGSHLKFPPLLDNFLYIGKSYSIIF